MTAAVQQGFGSYKRVILLVFLVAGTIFFLVSGQLMVLSLFNKTLFGSKDESDFWLLSFLYGEEYDDLDSLDKQVIKCQGSQ